MDSFTTRLLCEDLDGSGQADSRRRWNRDREPEIELMVPLVVLRYARVAIDRSNAILEVRLVDRGGHQRGAMAHRPAVENRVKLRDDAVLLQACDSLDDLLLGHVDDLPENSERGRSEWKVRLKNME